MVKIMNDEMKQNILKSVQGDLAFFSRDGRVIHSLNELSEALPDISDDNYLYHANHGNNDFSNWIRDVFGDKKLANDMRRLKRKGTAAKKVAERLNLLAK